MRYKVASQCFALLSVHIVFLALTNEVKAQQAPFQLIPQNAPAGLSCKGFGDYSEAHGVPGGVPGEAGHTFFQFNSSAIDAVDYRPQPTKYVCAQGSCADHTPYDTVAECREHCKGGLACILPPKTCQPTSNCASTGVAITFSLNTHSNGLVWPNAPKSQICKASVNSYWQALSVHEKGHYQDLVNLTNKTNAEWKVKRFNACGNTKTELDENLKNQVSQAATAQMKSLNAQAKALGDAYHLKYGLGVPLPSCTVCN